MRFATPLIAIGICVLGNDHSCARDWYPSSFSPRRAVIVPYPELRFHTDVRVAAPACARAEPQCRVRVAVRAGHAFGQRIHLSHARGPHGLCEGGPDASGTGRDSCADARGEGGLLESTTPCALTVLPNKRVKLTAPGCGRNCVRALACSVLLSICGELTGVGAAA